MADLTITNATPVTGAANAFGDGTAGSTTISRGMAVYRDTTDSYRYKPADSSSAAKATVVGLALNTSTAAGHPMRVQTRGQVTLGTTLEVGQVYVLSGTSNGGKICPVTDIDSGEYVTVLGVASSTTVLDLDINVTGIVSATNI